MNVDEIKNVVQTELNDISDCREDIQKLIVEPSIDTFENLEGEDQQLWIIGRKEEYFIVFDEKSGDFGLAFKNIVNLMVFLGSDGSLFHAYQTLISREEPSDKKPHRSSRFEKKDNKRGSRPGRGRQDN